MTGVRRGRLIAALAAAVLALAGSGLAVAGDGRAVTSLAAAKARAQAFADRLGGLRAGEVMQFANGYYSELMSVNAVSGAVWYHTWHGSFVAMAGE